MVQLFVLFKNVTDSGITLQFIHENRINVLRGVTKIVNEVCARAFRRVTVPQMIGKVGESSSSVKTEGGRVRGTMVGGGSYHPIINVPFNTSVEAIPHVGHGGTVNFGEGMPSSEKIGVSGHVVGVGNVKGYDLSTERQILNTELSDILSRVNLTVTEEEREVSPDDRSVFLTFSKGYPISETEVRDFFTRKFGDFIETIYMQDVPADEQALYARLIARSASVIEAIVGGGGRAKYTINGKHVWARKYVKKRHPKSPPRVTASPQSQPASPMAAPPPPP
ncbi:unnamed protein product [Ilex paraguariensis]|uniref:Uncharacterized protein n=1 Tax=Ilex paraguariensis TaxID=185542 RepID=A0ABC8TJA2_9AQUA